jgi:hypothetical protein
MLRGRHTVYSQHVGAQAHNDLCRQRFAVLDKAVIKPPASFTWALLIAPHDARFLRCVWVYADFRARPNMVQRVLVSPTSRASCQPCTGCKSLVLQECKLHTAVCCTIKTNKVTIVSAAVLCRNMQVSTLCRCGA